MELSKQVVSLELAKRLKELGLKQESLFYWVRYGREKKHYGEKFRIVFGIPTGLYDSAKGGTKAEQWEDGEIYAAFTVAELGEMLPEHYATHKVVAKQTYFSCWNQAADANDVVQVTADTEADARAKMLIYLIENKLLTL